MLTIYLLLIWIFCISTFSDCGNIHLASMLMDIAFFHCLDALEIAHLSCFLYLILCINTIVIGRSLCFSIWKIIICHQVLLSNPFPGSPFTACYSYSTWTFVLCATRILCCVFQCGFLLLVGFTGVAHGPSSARLMLSNPPRKLTMKISIFPSFSPFSQCFKHQNLADKIR